MAKMEETVSSKDGIWRMDADTFIPEPAGYLTLGGVEYPIYSFLDLPNLESIKVSKLGVDISKAEGFDEMLERSIEQIMILNAPIDPKTGKPKYTTRALAREQFNDLTPKQIVLMTMMANSTARVPLTAAAAPESAPSDSPAPSPASAASTDGSEIPSSV